MLLHSVGKRLIQKSKQRVKIKCFVKLKKSAVDTLQVLTEAYREYWTSGPRVFELHKRFSEGRENVKHDDSPFSPNTSVTANNNEKVRDVNLKDSRLSVWAIANVVNLHSEGVRHILTEELNMKRVSAKMIPQMLPAEPKELQKEICSDLWQRTQDESNLLLSVIISDASLIFTYDLGTKQ